MNNMLEYKGYTGSMSFNKEDDVFDDWLEFIRDLVTYEGVDAPGLKPAFQEAIDDYPEFCAAEEGARRKCH